MGDKPVKLSDEVILNHWKDYFESLLPLDKLDYDYRKDIEDNIKKCSLSGNVAFVCGYPIYKYTMIQALKKYGSEIGRMPTYLQITGYSLCEVWIKDAEIGVIRTLADTYQPEILLVIIEENNRRVKNKDYFSVINQVVVERSIRGKSTWFYYMGTIEKFKDEFSWCNIDNVVQFKLNGKKNKEVKSSGSNVSEFIC
jgi:hypothetical protein